MAGIIDIHAHVLPGVDDGPRNMDGALALCRSLAEQGVDTVVATPHMCEDVFRVSVEQLREGVRALQSACDEAGIELRVLPGGEVRIGPGLFEQIETGEAVTLGDAGTHLLLELNLGGVPRLTGVVRDLIQGGITPIIGHPERHRDFWRRPAPLHEWAEAGCLYQVTAGSLLGKLGRKPMELGRAMLQAGMVHSIASDAHKTRGKRQPWLGQVWRWLQETVGPLVAAQIMVNNPAVMVGMEPPGEPAAAVSAGPGTGSMHSNGT